MSLTQSEAEKVSLLARLELNQDELDSMTAQLGHILEYVRQLDELDTSGVEPLAHAIDIRDVLVQDQPHKSLDREQALSNAPKRDGECYRVPAVLGG